MGSLYACEVESSAVLRMHTYPLLSRVLPDLHFIDCRYHCLTPEWPCLSFDILQDTLGGGRTR